MAPPGQAANGLMIYIHSTVEIDIDIVRWRHIHLKKVDSNRLLNCFCCRFQFHRSSLLFAIVVVVVPVRESVSLQIQSKENDVQFQHPRGSNPRPSSSMI